MKYITFIFLVSIFFKCIGKFKIEQIFNKRCDSDFFYYKFNYDVSAVLINCYCVVCNIVTYKNTRIRCKNNLINEVGRVSSYVLP